MMIVKTNNKKIGVLWLLFLLVAMLISKLGSSIAYAMNDDDDGGGNADPSAAIESAVKDIKDNLVSVLYFRTHHFYLTTKWEVYLGVHQDAAKVLIDPKPRPISDVFPAISKGNVAKFGDPLYRFTVTYDSMLTTTKPVLVLMGPPKDGSYEQYVYLLSDPEKESKIVQSTSLHQYTSGDYRTRTFLSSAGRTNYLLVGFVNTRGPYKGRSTFNLFEFRVNASDIGNEYNNFRVNNVYCVTTPFLEFDMKKATFRLRKNEHNVCGYDNIPSSSDFRCHGYFHRGDLVLYCDQDVFVFVDLFQRTLQMLPAAVKWYELADYLKEGDVFAGHDTRPEPTFGFGNPLPEYDVMAPRWWKKGKRSGSLLPILIVLVVLLVIGGAIFICYCFIRNKTKKSIRSGGSDAKVAALDATRIPSKEKASVPMVNLRNTSSDSLRRCITKRTVTASVPRRDHHSQQRIGSRRSLNKSAQRLGSSRNLKKSASRPRGGRTPPPHKQH